MKVNSVIEDSEIVKKILKYLGLWDKKTSLRPVKPTPRRDRQWFKNTISTTRIPRSPFLITGYMPKVTTSA